MVTKSDLIDLFSAIYNVFYFFGLVILGLSLFASVTIIKISALLVLISSSITIKTYAIPAWKKAIINRR